MKIGITMYSFHRDFAAGTIDMQKFIEFAGVAGYDSCDLVAYFWKDREREMKEIPGWLKQAGVKLLTYAVGNKLLKHDKKELEAQMEIVRDGIRTAGKLGAPYVRVFGGADITGFTSATALDHVIDCFKSVMPLCREHNVTLGIENHGGYPGTSTEVKTVVEGVNDKHFTALFDTGNFLAVDENPATAAQVLSGSVGLVHVKDMVRLPAMPEVPNSYKPARAPNRVKAVGIGEGEVPIKECLQTLKKGGFDGYVTVEAEDEGDETSSAQAALSYLRKLVAELK